MHGVHIISHYTSVTKRTRIKRSSPSAVKNPTLPGCSACTYSLDLRPRYNNHLASVRGHPHPDFSHLHNVSELGHRKLYCFEYLFSCGSTFKFVAMHAVGDLKLCVKDNISSAAHPLTQWFNTKVHHDHSISSLLFFFL